MSIADFLSAVDSTNSVIQDFGANGETVNNLSQLVATVTTLKNFLEQSPGTAGPADRCNSGWFLLVDRHFFDF
mgnify:CR=1 FL=1